MEPSHSFELLNNISPFLVPVVNPTSSEAQSCQLHYETAPLDTTKPQVPPNVEVYGFRNLIY